MPASIAIAGKPRLFLGCRKLRALLASIIRNKKAVPIFWTGISKERSMGAKNY